MIDVKHLTKSYGSVEAVNDVSFEVNAREVVGFLGPNGAGKTTTLRIIAGVLGATRGRVLVDGIDTVDEPIRAKTRIGYMPENVPLYPEMRVCEYLRFRAELKGVQRKHRADAVNRSMRDVHIDDHSQVTIGNLSKGYRQRVGLADALVSRPSVLVLDEPTAGLDPNQTRDVRELIRTLAKQHAVLLSTHIMSEVEATCDRALVIHRGRLVAQGLLDELRSLRNSKATRFAVRGDCEHAAEVLRGIDGVRRIRDVGPRQDAELVEVRWVRDADQLAATERAVEALVLAGMHIQEVSPVKASLEDVFALLTDLDVAHLEAGESGVASGIAVGESDHIGNGDSEP
ncbi:MAG: ABC transporter ATP-binding protein [Polyangiaceae bacterium]|nr:ABC transporter ATP-binding protein [Polyangiaceae bacterium]